MVNQGNLTSINYQFTESIIVAKVSFPSNTKSVFSPWHYFASVSAEVRQTEDSMRNKPIKESFLSLFYD